MIYDTDNNQILSAFFDLMSAESKTFRIKIDCEAGCFLRCGVSTLTIEARKAGGVSWTNLQTDPIDLTPDAGTAQAFDIRITTGYVGSHDRRTVQLAVGRVFAPETPTGFSATANSSSEILCEWSRADGLATVAGYELRVNCPDMAIVNLVTDLGYVLENATIGIDPATEVFFELRAYNQFGDFSNWTEQISATTEP
jgi:hypothetical protein